MFSMTKLKQKIHQNKMEINKKMKKKLRVKRPNQEIQR